MDKKSTFPIKLKIIILTSLVLITAISFYIFYATNLFQKDKKAYIYETSLANSKSISSEVSSTLTSLGKDIDVLSRLFDSAQFNAIDEIISKTKYIKSFYWHKNKKIKYFSKDLKELNQKELSTKEGLAQIKYKNEVYLNYTVLRKNAKIGIIFEKDILLRIIESNRIYNSVVISKTGEQILGAPLNSDFLETIKPALKDHNTVRTTTIANEKLLFAISKLTKNDMVAISIIS